MKKIFTIFALTVMLFFCSSILFRFAVKNVLIDNGDENKRIDIISFDVKDNFVKEANETSEANANPLSVFIEAVKEKLPFNAEEKIFNSKEFSWDIWNNFNNRGDNINDDSYFKIKKEINRYATDLLVFNKVIVKFSNYILVDIVNQFNNGYIF